MFIIFDLDGTLADCEHRRHLVRKNDPDWRAFFAACVDDTPIQAVIDTLHAFNADILGSHKVEIWSGRSEEVRAETEQWLFDVGIRGNKLRMRPVCDQTPDEILKKQWLDEEPVKPDLVFDDRNKVVDMWRANGIICCQVAPGDF